MQLTVEILQAMLQTGDIVDGHLAQLGVVQHRPRFGQFALGTLMLAQRTGDRFQLGVLLRQLAEAGVVGQHLGLRKQQADFLVALGERFELAADRGGHGEGREVSGEE